MVSNISIEEFRNERYEYRSVRLAATLDEIERNLFLFEEKCQPFFGAFQRVPTNPTHARVTIWHLGATQANPWVLVDLEEVDDGTAATAYVAMATWQSKADRILRAAVDPMTCE